MGIQAGSIFGDLDLEADAKGFLLDVPAQCPFRPVGLRAVLSDLSLTDFPVKPDLKDCYSAEIGKLAGGAVEGAEDAVNFGEGVAKDAAATAVTLGEGAVESVKSLHLEKAAAWGPAMVAHVADVRSAKDAMAAANKGVKAAESTVKSLTKEIAGFDNRIEDLGNDLQHLLKQIWNVATGKVKDLRHKKSDAEAKRDIKRTAKAAAVKRVAKAKALVAKAGKDLPGPDLDGPVAEKQEQLWAAQAQAEVQPRVAEYATKLAAALKEPNQRREILAAVDIKAFIAAREKDFGGSYPTLAALTDKTGGRQPMATFLSDSKKALIEEAVMKRIAAETENTLKQTVSGLPSMAFDVPVSLVNGEGAAAPCLDFTGKMSACSNSDAETFVFRNGGKVEAGKLPKSTSDACLSFDDKSHTLQRTACDKPTMFFFDPLDGLIRYLPENANAPQCLLASANRQVTSAPCPSPGETLANGQWRLASISKSAAAVSNSTRKSGNKAKDLIKTKFGPVPSLRHRTNLEPLEL